MHILGAVGSSTVYYSSSTTKHNILDLNCTGNENTILDCPYNGLSNYSCSLSKDANIFCECECYFLLIEVILSFLALNVATYSNCTDGDIRLIGGVSEYQGRVEVCLNRAWGTVCTSSWGSQDALVVCNQIGALTIGIQFCTCITLVITSIVINQGYSYGRVGSLGFSQGSGPILLGYLYCNGEESNLVECSQNYRYTHIYCQSHYYDAAVICESNNNMHCVLIFYYFICFIAQLQYLNIFIYSFYLTVSFSIL